MSSADIRTAAAGPRRGAFLLWLPTILWLVVLACFSTDTFSADHTGSVLWKVLHFFDPALSAARFYRIHFFVRKTAHFVSYGTLSLFAFYGVRGMQSLTGIWRARWSVLALLLTLAAASMDEFHQSFVASRTSSSHDVWLDMTGAVTFQLVIVAIFRWRESRSREY